MLENYLLQGLCPRLSRQECSGACLSGFGVAVRWAFAVQCAYGIGLGALRRLYTGTAVSLGARRSVSRRSIRGERSGLGFPFQRGTFFRLLFSLGELSHE
jgi:hypothetical protein